VVIHQWVPLTHNYYWYNRWSGWSRLYFIQYINNIHNSYSVQKLAFTLSSILWFWALWVFCHYIYFLDLHAYMQQTLLKAPNRSQSNIDKNLSWNVGEWMWSGILVPLWIGSWIEEHFNGSLSAPAPFVLHEWIQLNSYYIKTQRTYWLECIKGFLFLL
jgi:hypothetical protein